MIFRKSTVSIAVAHLLAAVTTGVAAQESAPKSDGMAPEARVMVIGTRAAIEHSINVKKNASTNIEVVTAEDVGKMPDVNIGDSLSRLSGVNVSYNGSFLGEAERVSLRGTPPNLNLVTLNGHALASGDWQPSAPGRSVGFSLLPSQLIGQAIVYKTQRADLTEGGLSGSVDILLRQPLQFKKGITGSASIGAAYSDLPRATDPTAGLLVNWRSESGTLGLLTQAYKEKRTLRRDASETFNGYSPLTASQAKSAGDASLVGKLMPQSLNAAFFEQQRTRTTFYLGAQLKPSSDLDVKLGFFRSELDAYNYNSSGFARPVDLVNQGWLVKDAVVVGDVITKARLVRPTTLDPNRRVIGFQFDNNARPEAWSLSSFVDLDVAWKPLENLSYRLRLGTTGGKGETGPVPSMIFAYLNPNVSYALYPGTGRDYSVTSSVTGLPADLSRPDSFSLMKNLATQFASSDKEDYAHLDAEYLPSSGLFTSFKWGVRFSRHVREYTGVGARWKAEDKGGVPISPAPGIGVSNGTLASLSNLPVYAKTVAPTAKDIVPFSEVPTPNVFYPENFGSGLYGSYPQNMFRLNLGQIAEFYSKHGYYDPVGNMNWVLNYTVAEPNKSIYVMGDYELTNHLRGDIGVRFSQTDVYSLSYQALTGVCKALEPCKLDNAITSSRYAAYIPQIVSRRHVNTLPSFNMRWQPEQDHIVRFAVSRGLGRPSYNELAGQVVLNNTQLTGTSGNPKLSPTTSNNIDVSWQWHFARRAYVQAGVFGQWLSEHVKFGQEQLEFLNTSTGGVDSYLVKTRRGVKAKLKGAELATEFPIGLGFGFGGNLTYISSQDEDGVPLLGTSRWTYNMRGFYESNKFTATIAWNYRTAYGFDFVGEGKSQHGRDPSGNIILFNGQHIFGSSGTLSASVGYKYSDSLSFSVNAVNILNPVRHTYYNTTNAPGNFDQTGRTFFFQSQMKF